MIPRPSPGTCKHRNVSTRPVNRLGCDFEAFAFSLVSLLLVRGREREREGLGSSNFTGQWTRWSFVCRRIREEGGREKAEKPERE